MTAIVSTVLAEQLGRMNQISRVFALLDKSGKRRLVLLGALIFCHTILEVVVVALVLPFIALINNPQLIASNGLIRAIYAASHLRSPDAFLTLFGIGLFALIVFKNVYFYGVLRLQMSFGFGQAAQIAERLFQRYLAAPYTLHVERNSADLINTVDDAADIVLAETLVHAVQLVTELAAVAGIVLLMLVIEPKLTLLLGIVLGGASVAMASLLRRDMRRLGKNNVRLRAERLQCLQQSFASIKEIKVLGREAYFRRAFHAIRAEHARNQARFRVRLQMPRPVLEIVVAGGVVLAVVVLLLEGRATTDIIGALALFAMAAFRVLPSANRIVYAYHQMTNSAPAIETVARDLLGTRKEYNPPAVATLPMSFTNSIELRDVSLSYADRSASVLKHISLRIGRGEAIGLVGASGAGKTTLVDVLLGLLPPDQGAVLVDGSDIAFALPSWRRIIGYVPQFISLIDDTLRNNVAFGLDAVEIDDLRIWQVLEFAQLRDFVQSLPDGLDTMLGERGVRLSGGQRQRIGIARALYHDPDVLILDEATSALDNESEREITKAIEALLGEKTLVVVAHRLSTVKRCDRLVLLSNGAVVDSGSFGDLMARCDEFRDLVRLGELTGAEPRPVSTVTAH
jgi:ATP-binding cassette subfamily C protein